MEFEYAATIVDRLAAAGVETPPIVRQHPEMVYLGTALRIACEHGVDYRLLFSNLDWSATLDSMPAITSAGSSPSAEATAKN
jgi:hypothetical protein